MKVPEIISGKTHRPAMNGQPLVTIYYSVQSKSWFQEGERIEYENTEWFSIKYCNEHFVIHL